MPVEVHRHDPRNDAQRIADRLRPSASSENVSTQMVHGSGRASDHTVHRSGHQAQHRPAIPGEQNIKEAYDEARSGGNYLDKFVR